MEALKEEEEEGECYDVQEQLDGVGDRNQMVG